jgi:hypothetical protein
VQERGVLTESAIIIQAGENKEDRMLTGSYVEAAKQRSVTNAADSEVPPAEFYVPPSSNVEEDTFATENEDDPFGL